MPAPISIPVCARARWRPWRARVVAGALMLAAMLGEPARAGELLAAPPSDGYFIRNWRVDEGLPHNAVNRVVQDARGFLWVATGGGIARFDGREFKDYPLPVAHDASYNIRDLVVEDDRSLLMVPASGGVMRLRDGAIEPHPASAALAGRQLLWLFLEPKGALWAVSGQELLRYENGLLEVFGPREGLMRGSARVSFATDRRGRVWIGGGEFLACYENGRLRRYPENIGSFVSIAAARSGGLWIATGDRLLKMEDDIVRTVVSGPEWSDERVGMQEMFEDRRGILWIATRRFGLSQLVEGRLRRVATSHDQTVSVMEDVENNIWVSTNGGGIDRLRPQAFVRVDASSGLPDPISTSVCVDAAGTLWCANRRGGLVSWRDGQARVFAAPASLPSLYMNVVCPGSDGTIWAGGIQGLVRLSNRPGAELERVPEDLPNVHVLYGARNGDVWVGSGDHKLGYFRAARYREIRPADEFGGRRVRAIAENSHGAIFVGTDDRQLFEVVNEKLEPRIAREQMPGGLIYALHCDRDDTLWIGTSHGLVMRRGETLKRFSTAEGLPDDLISQVLEDDRGMLWLGSRRGVFSVALADLRAVAAGRAARVNANTFGREEGLRGASALSGMQPMAWKAGDGRLWFATNDGLVGIDPAASLPPIVPPRVYVDQVRVDQQLQPVGTELRLPPGAQQVEFRFVALNYAAPEKVRVRHRLSGYDFDWIELNGESRASYSRLPPGRYELAVAASNQDGRWSEMKTPFALIVVPAWWQTWWWRSALALGFTALVGGGARYWSLRRLRARLQRLEREHALEKERARIARDLHDDLGGSLTQIGLLAERLKRQADDPALKPALGQLAWRTRRLTGELESIVWTVSPKNNTWDRLAAFIAQYVRGFCRDTTLQCSVSGEDAIPAVPLAPEAQHHVLALVKEAINNVFKHAQATQLTVGMSVRDGAFVLQIADNGIGFDPAATENAERNGLSNMRSRAADLGGELTIRSRRGAGTEIEFRQPLGTANAAPRANP